MSCRDVPGTAARRAVLRLRYRCDRGVAGAGAGCRGTLCRLCCRSGTRGQYLSLLGEVGFERVRLAEAKPVALPDDALAPHMDAEELAAFRASGIVLKSVTVLGSKPATAN